MIADYMTDYTFSMPTWVKVVLVIVLVGFVLLAAGIVIAARWVKSQQAALQEQGKRVIAEAKAFGAGKDGEACVAEALQRVQAASGFIGEAKVKVFLQHCLSAANVAPRMCDGVPAPAEIMNAARWTLDECARRGKPNDQRCTRLIGALQMHCATMKK
jgi:hypothetical protein